MYGSHWGICTLTIVEVFMFDYINQLERSPLFYGFESSCVEKLLNKINYTVKVFCKSEAIFSSIMTAENIGIILYGEVLIQKYVTSEKIVTLGTKRAPDMLAGPSLFSCDIYYLADSFAYTDVELLIISKKSILMLFELDSRISLNYLKIVSNEMIKLKNKITILSKNSLKEKIALYLLNLSNTHNSDVLEMDVSKKELALELNITRTSLSREFKKLQDSNIINFKNRKVIILDKEYLSTILVI